MSSPRIDVLVPVYNGEKFIKESIYSIQNQTCAEIVIHIVDDGSTDGTLSILTAIAASDDRIRIYRKPNSGIVDALNEGLANCQAEFIARHDADDNAYPERLERQLTFMLANPQCVAVSAAARHIDARGIPLGSVGRGAPPEDADADAIPAREPYLIHPFLMARRDSILKIGGYRHVYHSEDTDLYWRLRELGSLHNLPDILGEYRLHDNSISGQSIENGRIMALSSQLSAISALRRSRNESDIEFSRASIERYKNRAGSLAGLFESVKPILTGTEVDHLHIATSAKLVELAGYRPYELELDDCEFARIGMARALTKLSKENRALVRRQYSGTAARLAYKGRFKEASALLWPALIPAFGYRYVLNVLLPPSLRAVVKRAIGEKVTKRAFWK